MSANQNPLAQVAEQVPATEVLVDTTEQSFEEAMAESVDNSDEELLDTASIVAREKRNGAKTVKVAVSSIRTYTNDNGFISIVFGLKKQLPSANGKTTDAYFAGWKEVRSILVSEGYEQFALLLDFDKKDDEATEAKRLQRLNLVMTYLLPNCMITLLSREITSGVETLSNPFSTRNDEGAYFVPTQDAIRYNCYKIELSVKAKEMLATMERAMIANAASLLL